jgi:hypothetical protein
METTTTETSRVKKFYIPMSYEVTAIQVVEASSLEDALTLAMNGEGYEMSQSYVGGSVEIEEELITASQPDIGNGQFVRVWFQNENVSQFIGYVIEVDELDDLFTVVDQFGNKYLVTLDDLFPLTENELSNDIPDDLRIIVKGYMGRNIK